MLWNLHLSGIFILFDYKHSWRFFCLHSWAENEKGENAIGCCDEKPWRSWGVKVLAGDAKLWVPGELNPPLIENKIIFAVDFERTLNQIHALQVATSASGTAVSMLKHRSCAPCWELMLKEKQFGSCIQKYFPVYVVHDRGIWMHSTGYHVFLLCLEFYPLKGHHSKWL